VSCMVGEASSRESPQSRTDQRPSAYVSRLLFCLRLISVVVFDRSMTDLINDICQLVFPHEFHTKTQEESLRGALQLLHLYVTDVLLRCSLTLSLSLSVSLSLSLCVCGCVVRTRTTGISRLLCSCNWVPVLCSMRILCSLLL